VDIVDPEVQRYLHELANPRDPILREMELLAAERDFPIVGPQVGRLLYVLTACSGAKRVLELGSGFGYSAYWFARAVGPGGHVVLTEGSADRAREAEEFLNRGGFGGRYRIEVGDAFATADRLGGTFDILFNDADKERYPDVFDLACSLLEPGGLLISDNMLWYGTVLDDTVKDASTAGIRELTRRLYASEEFATTLLPVRDGVTVSVRRRA
jgi:predicted O-methyltransferase YrrM